MGIEVRVEGLEDVLEALEKMSEKELMDAAAKGLKKGLGRIRDDARANCPVDTGDLRERIGRRVRREKGALVGEVYSGAPHGIYVEMGTGPKGEMKHAGVNPEWLSNVTYSPRGWHAPIKGEVRFIKGYAARPFLYPAFKANEAKAQEDVKRAIIKHVTGG